MKRLHRYWNRSSKRLAIVSGFILTCWFFLFQFNRFDLKKTSDEFNKFEISKYPFATNYERKDWHDYKFIAYEMSRQGPGEQGKPFELTDPEDLKLSEKLFEIEGVYVLVSDRISVNRSVPDTRLPQCQSIKYLKELPSTSVIVIFHNEHPSLILRTVHSLYNRTPHELLHEIIMVNDASTNEELYEPLQKYVRENFDGRVKIVNLEKRKGLIVARMEGARRATGEVLVFLDSHMEANVNWLPPLLEPIAIDPKTSTVPVLDNFRHDNFEYTGGDGSRGIFDWDLTYHWLPRRPEDNIRPEQPAPLPVMLGCAFAIRKDYFFDLGGYDEQLIIWNGENYELSLKLHLCGGKLLEVPCSRIAHFFRKRNKFHTTPSFDNVGFNLKRIAEVWLDDYKHYMYRRNPGRYDKIDPGDLSHVKLIKKNLNCKPFQYFLDYVAPDMLERYPYESRGVFASGLLRPEADMDSCVNTIGLEASAGNPLGLYPCNSNGNQDFIFSWHRNIMKNDINEHCIDTHKAALYGCHFSLGNQYWFYNLETHQLINTPDQCLAVNMDTRRLEIATCNATDINQKWNWEYLNVTAIQNWETFGVKLP